MYRISQLNDVSEWNLQYGVISLLNVNLNENIICPCITWKSMYYLTKNVVKQLVSINS